ILGTPRRAFPTRPASVPFRRPQTREPRNATEALPPPQNRGEGRRGGREHLAIRRQGWQELTTGATEAIANDFSRQRVECTKSSPRRNPDRARTDADRTSRTTGELRRAGPQNVRADSHPAQLLRLWFRHEHLWPVSLYTSVEEARSMVARPWVAVVVVGALSSMAAQYRTKNFVVEAPSPQMAQRIGQWAEYHRKQKALEWLGKEMPTWPQPCPLRVKVTYAGSGGATSFAFDRGRILSQEMEIQGTPERLVHSVL